VPTCLRKDNPEWTVVTGLFSRPGIAELAVTNTLDRPVQVTSHYHFFEVNRGLKFDRTTAYGVHLDVPAGTAVRFEPGETKTVRLAAIGGTREVYSHAGLVNGYLNQTTRDWHRSPLFEIFPLCLDRTLDFRSAQLTSDKICHSFHFPLQSKVLSVPQGLPSAAQRFAHQAVRGWQNAKGDITSCQAVYECFVV